MRTTRTTSLASRFVPLALTTILLVGGCGKSNQQQANQPSQAPNSAAQQGMNPEAASPQQGANNMPPPPPSDQYPAQQSAPPRPAPSDIPAGTHIVVTLRETLSTKTSQPGEHFTATVASPVLVHGVTLVRRGSRATGTVVDSKSPGHFKGQGELSIRLDDVEAEGRIYHVASSTVDRVESGKGKRTAGVIGGASGFGAILGGLAGGGRGALIGGLAGAGAGTAGAAFTGNKDVEIPAETRLTFRLERAVPLQ